jgi:hypothetical protein
MPGSTRVGSAFRIVLIAVLNVSKSELLGIVDRGINHLQE